MDRVAVTEGSRGFQPTVGNRPMHSSRSDGGTCLLAGLGLILSSGAGFRCRSRDTGASLRGSVG